MKSKILYSSFLFLFSVSAKEIVNDVTQINPITVNRVVAPTSIDQIQKLLKEHKGIVSIGGGRYSMGGQTATENTLQIDMRKMNKVLNLDIPNKKISVQAGIRWRDIQEIIDPANLSIKIMQTYSNFTVGGSLSVNVHGRYVGQGPLIRSVDSFKIITADGILIEASPTLRPDIFYGAIGGYGGLGVIVEATLQLVDNEKVERIATLIPAQEYKKYFFTEIRNNSKYLFHNGDIYPPDFTQVSAVSYRQTDKELTHKERLIPRNEKYVFQPAAITAMTIVPGGRKLRAQWVDPYLYSKEKVVWRNYEASYDVAELEPHSRKHSTYVLQEYFIPVESFDEFIPKMTSVFKKYDVEVFNVSIRHALPDPGSLLAWAREEVFAFVVYYRQGTSPKDKMEVGEWTREMISEILSVGGTYYLPYQIHATDHQFQQAYPRFQEFFELKSKLDPEYKFRNKLWDRYYISIPDEISEMLPSIKGYHRPEEQSYLALPEWYIVFNGDEYADYLKDHKPSGFPYFASMKEFWDLKSQVQAYIKNKYPKNTGYVVMLWVLGISYSVELGIKSLYENTIGRLTEWLSSDVGTSEDVFISQTHKDYVDFIHVSPWYEYSFYKRLKSFWTEIPLTGDNMIRKWERRLFFTVELLVKSIYGWLIEKATRMSYEVEPSEIHAIIYDPKLKFDDIAKPYPEITIIKSSKNIHLVRIPRYDALRDLLKKIAHEDFKFVEIAGNRKIFLTLIAEKGAKNLFEDGEVIGESDIPTEPHKKRLLVSTSVFSFTDMINKAQRANMVIEHTFDY